MNEGFAVRADALQIADGLGNRQVIRHCAGGSLRFAAFDAIHLAGPAGLFGILATLGVEFPEIMAMKQCRLAIVQCGETLLDPVSDGVLVNAQQPSGLIHRVGPVDLDQLRIWPPVAGFAQRSHSAGEISLGGAGKRVGQSPLLQI